MPKFLLTFKKFNSLNFFTQWLLLTFLIFLTSCFSSTFFFFSLLCVAWLQLHQNSESTAHSYNGMNFIIFAPCWGWEGEYLYSDRQAVWLTGCIEYYVVSTKRFLPGLRPLSPAVCHLLRVCPELFLNLFWKVMDLPHLRLRVRLHLLICWSECRQSLLPSLKCHPSSKAFHEIRCSKFIPSSMLFWSNQLFFSFPMCFFEHFRETSPEANIRVCGELESKGFPRERLLQSE